MAVDSLPEQKRVIKIPRWKMSALPNWVRADVIEAGIQQCGKSVCRVQNKNRSWINCSCFPSRGKPKKNRWAIWCYWENDHKYEQIRRMWKSSLKDNGVEETKNLWISKDLWSSKLVLINLLVHDNIGEAAVKSKREVVRKQAVPRVMSCPPDILGWTAVGCCWLNLLTLSSGFLWFPKDSSLTFYN